MREEGIQACMGDVLPLYFHHQQLLFDNFKINDCKHFLIYIYLVIIYMAKFAQNIYSLPVCGRQCNINMILYFLFEPLGWLSENILPDLQYAVLL